MAKKFYKKQNLSYEERVQKVKERDEGIFKTFTDMMVEKIQGIKADWKKPWFTDGAFGVPKNIYGKEYNGMNAIMLTWLCEEKGYKIPVFVTPDHLYAMNFKDNNIKGGVKLTDEEGNKLPFVHRLADQETFPVFVSALNIRHRDTHEKIEYKDYIKLSDEEKEMYEMKHFRTPHFVLNIDQTNIKEARPELYEKLAAEYKPKEISDDIKNGQIHIDVLDYIFENNRWLCNIIFEHQDVACYSPGRDRILLPEREQFMAKGDNGEEFYGTGLHEMIHSTGHESRENRFKKNEDGVKPSTDADIHRNSYGWEELVAELGSAYMMYRFGYMKSVKSTENSAAYLDNWLKNLNENPRYIEKVYSYVKDACYRMSQHFELIEKEMKQEQQDDVEQDDGEEENKEKAFCADIDGDGVIEADETHLTRENEEEKHRSYHSR